MRDDKRKVTARGTPRAVFYKMILRSKVFPPFVSMPADALWRGRVREGRSCLNVDLPL